MRISVIMGAFNVEKTIARAIDSILSQTCSDWVFIICDDGSSDHTWEIVSTYKTNYPEKIILIKNEQNKGLTYSLNKCLQYVETEYVARMDADDISLPNRLEEEIRFLDSHPEYAFVGCAVERFDENGAWMKCQVEERPQKDIFYNSSGFAHPTIMIRKSALEKVNNYREKWYTNRCEDYDLWMRLYSAGYKGYNINKQLFMYYEGKDSFPKKKYKYRICEAVMRAKGYSMLGMYPKGLFYVVKPLIAGLLPSKLAVKIHKKRMGIK